MKRSLSYLLLLIIIIFSVSACGSKSDAPVAETTTYLSVQLLADAGNEEVTLDWQMVAGATTYNIYYIADTTGTYSSTNKPSTAVMKAGTEITGVISALYEIAPLTNNTTYWFAISAVTSSGESDLSVAVSATPSTTAIPAAPENVRANAGNAQVTVTWTPVAGVDHYIVYCYTQSGLTLNEGKNVGNIPQADSSYIVDSNTIDWIEGSYSGVTPNSIVNGTTYYFFVVSVSSTSQQNTSFFEAATPSATPPPFAPVITSVTAGNAQITVHWNAVSASPAVASYNIYIGTAKGVTKSSGAKNPYTPDTGDPGPYSAIATTNIDNGTTYYIVITAVNSNGESAESTEWWAKPASVGGTSGPID
ncbi:MAG TPA: hypothetical protein VMU29_02675 [Smithella sp.]|nr:hypothetical protein [Smithella sp.]